MKNLLALFMLTISLTFGLSQATFATVQDEIDTTTVVEETAAVEEEVVETTPEVPSAAVEESPSFHQVIKQKFIEGGPSFMGIVLLCLILGLALCIERIIYLKQSYY